MKIRVSDIEYDISRDDIYDNIDCIFTGDNDYRTTEDDEKLLFSLDAVSYRDDDFITVVFEDRDDDIVYYYLITEIDEDNRTGIGKLLDKQPFYGDNGYRQNIINTLDQELTFEISDEEAEDMYLEDCIADYISGMTNFLVEGFAWEKIE